jgi:hypothetical protein
MAQLEQKESEVRSWIDYLVEHAYGNERIAYNMILACADLIGHQGRNTEACILYSTAEALRAGDKDEVDFSDGWGDENGNLNL